MGKRVATATPTPLIALLWAVAHDGGRWTSHVRRLRPVGLRPASAMWCLRNGGWSRGGWCHSTPLVYRLLILREIYGVNRGRLAIGAVGKKCVATSV